MYPDPGTTRLIHDTMIHEELQRAAPEHHPHDREPLPMRGPGMALRSTTARALYWLATRLAPAPNESMPSPRTGASI